MDYKDYYQTLGVDRTADQKAIQKAFRQLARKHHPDVNPNNKDAEAKFKEINEAYEVLSDPEKRVKYDQFGKDWQQAQQAQQAGASGGFDSARGNAASGGGTQAQYTYTTENMGDIFGDSGDYSDFFENLFGSRSGGSAQSGGSTGQQPRRGTDAESAVQITLEEAYRGTSRLLSREGRETEVRIPPGVKTGSRVRLNGQGGPGRNGAEAGDLYLIIEVLPDERFERRDDDLYIDFDLPLYMAVLGGKVEVTTLNGIVQLAIPPETQNNRLFRLRGRGMPIIKNPSEHGDLYAKAVVRLPTHLSDKERALFEQLHDLNRGS
ncbi:MAG: J domain-containing protein [Chloroflexota bacterium]